MANRRWYRDGATSVALVGPWVLEVSNKQPGFESRLLLHGEAVWGQSASDLEAATRAVESDFSGRIECIVRGVEAGRVRWYAAQVDGESEFRALVAGVLLCVSGGESEGENAWLWSCGADGGWEVSRQEAVVEAEGALVRRLRGWLL